MPGGPLSEVIRYLRRVAGPSAEEASDGQLLERFVDRRDESAFEALMARHGPMVLGVCRRILHDAHDADDAFQATFLVLAHKARSIGRPQALGSWLYRIAQRTAVRAKVQRNRRRAHESILDDLPAAEAVEDLAWHELRPVLDEEINRLPRKYRDAIVHCYLQEKTYTEAAKTLGLASGTISSRLARARDILRKRLLRRGLALSSSLLATLLAQQALSAAVPGALRTITTQAALRIAAGQTILAGLATEPVAALTKEVLKAMFVTKIRLTGIVLLVVGVFGAGAGVLTHEVLAEKQIGTPKAEAPPAAAPAPLAPNLLQERFESAFGYTWILHPRKIDIDPDDVLKRRKNNPGAAWENLAQGGFKGGFAAMIDLDENKAVTFTLATGGADHKSISKYRPVVFDAQRKRYLPSARLGLGAGCGPKVFVLMSRYALTAKTLPAEKIRYWGLELLTVKGRKAIADRARTAGVDVLPPRQLDQAYEFTLTTLDGKKIRSRDLRGKVVLIAGWGLRYHPEIMPKLKPLYDQYHKNGLEIIGVNVGQDEEKRVKEYCAQQRLAWPQVLVPGDEKTHELWEDTAGLSANQLLLLDREGILRADCNFDQLEKEITKLLDQPAQAPSEPKK